MGDEKFRRIRDSRRDVGKEVLKKSRIKTKLSKEEKAELEFLKAIALACYKQSAEDAIGHVDLSFRRHETVIEMRNAKSIDSWKDFLEKNDIGYEVTDNFMDSFKITLDPVSLLEFINQSEPLIEGMKALEMQRKKVDPTGDPTDSYLIANINSIKRYCEGIVEPLGIKQHSGGSALTP